MILNKIEDPRDNLEKAHRLELVRFAHAQGVSDVNENMPAMLIRRVLRMKGLTRITIPPRSLGQQSQPGSVPTTDQKVPEVNAEDDLMRQFKAQSQPTTLPNLGINELRAKCKELGIKLTRKDNMISMRAKIEGHGQ
jgi:hypothetical protein